MESREVVSREVVSREVVSREVVLSEGSEPQALGEGED